MRDWDVYPAIDLRRGRVVRLAQGDPGREKKYSDDPSEVAQRWQEAGTRWIHVVNLDGAFDESSQENQTALQHILATRLRVQFGGGLRDLATIRRALDLGVSRAVVGTMAVENPASVEAALAAFGPERVAMGLDVRGAKVYTHGWKEMSAYSAVELAQKWMSQGGRWIIFTDIARDGMGGGLNMKATVELAQATGLQVIASGGIASLDDVRRAYEAGLNGVIIGKALYEGLITLEETLCVDTCGRRLYGQGNNPQPSIED